MDATTGTTDDYLMMGDYMMIFILFFVVLPALIALATSLFICEMEKDKRGEDDAELGDFIESEESENPEDVAVRKARSDAIHDALKCLTERERIVIEERYGLRDGDAKTLEMVGVELGVSRERIRQIQVKAERKLRRPKIKKVLKPLL